VIDGTNLILYLMQGAFNIFRSIVIFLRNGHLSWVMNGDIFLQKYSCEDSELMKTFDMLCLKATYIYKIFQLRQK
jgi:hypothetical protein